MNIMESLFFFRGVKMSEPFYRDGLKFECQRCSYCCRHEPGYVFLSEKDLMAMAGELEMKREAFIEKYCSWVDIGFFKRLSLIEKDNNDCIFWSESGCEVYKARPLQCRSYPFWVQVVENEESWSEESASCPGIGKGKLHSAEEIGDWLQKRLDDPLINS
ncbi:MAG: YkgJ family cysteine cluster protein [Spirochaetales bacterium]|nr:YkgJ family cysteine cluster protein [Spirochaetales bacterium]